MCAEGLFILSPPPLCLGISIAGWQRSIAGWQSQTPSFTSHLRGQFGDHLSDLVQQQLHVYLLHCYTIHFALLLLYVCISSL